MPPAVPADEDDPVVASYDVYFTGSKPDENETSKLLVLQYPSHRRRSKPYNVARSQKPHSLRIKPETGLVEMEVPILTQEYYNPHASEKFGQALFESRMSQRSRSYGLAGGFSASSGAGQEMHLDDIPQHNDVDQNLLKTQILGGKIASPSERDPVYMLGVFRHNELHLSHLDAIVQMRPQLHHIDAEEELNQRKFQTAPTPSSKVKLGMETAPGKLETKAIELKLKDNKEDTKDRNLNENARLLRDIQREAWQTCQWQDQAASESRHVLRTSLEVDEVSRHTRLQGLVNNDEWLEKMSAPREDGKKGLRSKLKGRDRERARRKKVENQKRLAHVAATTVAEVSSEDTDVSAGSDVDIVDPTDGLDQDDVKQEPGNLAAAPEQVSQVPLPVPTTVTPAKRRGRPRKEVAHIE